MDGHESSLRGARLPQVHSQLLRCDLDRFLIALLSSALGAALVSLIAAPAAEILRYSASAATAATRTPAPDRFSADWKRRQPLRINLKALASPVSLARVAFTATVRARPLLSKPYEFFGCSRQLLRLNPSNRATHLYLQDSSLADAPVKRFAACTFLAAG